MNVLSLPTPPEAFGRYVLYPAIARGGMATVHPARLVGAEGFSRLVAAKRLHQQFTDDPDFVTMFHDEARIASRIHHPNVVPVLDVVIEQQELILVLEYVNGVPLNQLMRQARDGKKHVPLEIVVAIMAGSLAGLHAAHEATDDNGQSLQIVHRDISPQNVMLSVDGVPRILDFGIAKARSNSYHTREGLFKGKLGYMAPEQIRMAALDRTADVYAMGVLLWELLTNRRYHGSETDAAFVAAILEGTMPTVTEAIGRGDEARSDEEWAVIDRLEDVVMRAIAVAPKDRYATAEEMQRAILEVAQGAASLETGAWLRAEGAEYIEKQSLVLRAASEDSLRNLPLGEGTSTSGVQRISGGVLARTAESDAAKELAPGSISFIATEPAKMRWLLGIVVGALFVGGAIGGVAQGLGRGVERQTSSTQGGQPPSIEAKEGLANVATATANGVSAVANAATTHGSRDVEAAPGPNLAGGAAAPLTSFAPIRVAAPQVAAPQGNWAKRVSVPTTHPPPVSAPTDKSPPAPAPDANASAKNDCNPPFYFEGAKKIFKPKCL